MSKPAPVPEHKQPETQAEIHELLQHRWSPVAFDERPVEPEKLRSILEAARWAASSYNEQPWAFIVATKDNPEEFGKLLGCLVEGNQAWAERAPVLMFSVAKLAFEKNSKPNRHAYHDVGLAVANLVIQATAHGLHVHQMAGILPDKAREAYAIPEGWEPVAGIAVGYLGDPSTLPEKLRKRDEAERSRRPLEEFVFTGRWGQPASVTR